MKTSSERLTSLEAILVATAPIGSEELKSSSKGLLRFLIMVVMVAEELLVDRLLEDPTARALTLQ